MERASKVIGKLKLPEGTTSHEAVACERRVGQRQLAADSGPLTIGPQRRCFARLIQYLRHGFDAGCLDFVQTVHVRQNLIEIVLKFADLIVSQRQVGQVGNVTNLTFGDLHARSLFREAL